MTDRTCTCGNPIPAHDPAFVCRDCWAEARTLLSALPDLVDDINLTVTRQTAGAQRNGPRSTAGETLAWNEAASRALARALSRLVSWARDMGRPVLQHELDTWLSRRDWFHAAAQRETVRERADHLHAVAEQYTPTITRLRLQLMDVTGPRWVVAASHRKLVGILEDEQILRTIECSPSAPDFLGDLRRCSSDLLAATDSPPPRLYLGPCRADPLKSGYECPEEVYALDHSDQGKDHLCDKCRTVRCHTCGTEHDVAQRRTWLKEAMDDRLANAGDIARGLAGTTGLAVTKDQINGWVTRGRLVRHGADKYGAALYRVGDVIDLASEASRRAERGA